MPAHPTERFISALHALEAQQDVDGIATLFAGDADVGNAATTREYHGRDGAREFWSSYRETFGEVRSEFISVVDGDDRAALEWRTRGSLATGEPLDYSGVSVLEFRDGEVSRFRAYFDPRAVAPDTAS
jgi:ketosteroid isomerase-like protein